MEKDVLEVLSKPPVVGTHKSSQQNKFFWLPPETAYLRVLEKKIIPEIKTFSSIAPDNRYPFGWVSGDFYKPCNQAVVRGTNVACAYVYDQIQSGTYQQIFGSFMQDLDVVSFETHQQIKNFIKNSLDLLPGIDSYVHLLYKNTLGEYRVAYVGRSLEICVFPYDFLYSGIWIAEATNRFVVLAKKTKF